VGFLLREHVGKVLITFRDFWLFRGSRVGVGETDFPLGKEIEEY
jgi:hypothetical protein